MRLQTSATTPAPSGITYDRGFGDVDWGRQTDIAVTVGSARESLGECRMSVCRLGGVDPVHDDGRSRVRSGVARRGNCQTVPMDAARLGDVIAVRGIAGHTDPAAHCTVAR